MDAEGKTKQEKKRKDRGKLRQKKENRERTEG